MASGTYAAIRQAILDRQVVTAIYQGRPRVMCPHALGWNKEGEEQALFYQFDGESSRPLGPPGSPANWRCLTLSELTSVSVASGAWHTSPKHTSKQTCISRLDVEVDY